MRSADRNRFAFPHACRYFFLAFAMGWCGLIVGQAQVPAADAATSDDIIVADGLQLPDYGVIWGLDTWNGVDELVQFKPADTTEHALSLRAVSGIELKGEAARIRIHDTTPQIFIRGVSGDSAAARAGFVIVPLTVDGNRRRAAKAASLYLAAERKHKSARSNDVVELTQERIGISDWYRLTPGHALLPGEYAIVPLASDPSAVLDGVRDFAIDPEAPENLRAIRSEKNRSSE